MKKQKLASAELRAQVKQQVRYLRELEADGSERAPLLPGSVIVLHAANEDEKPMTITVASIGIGESGIVFHGLYENDTPALNIDPMTIDYVASGSRSRRVKHVMLTAHPHLAQKLGEHDEVDRRAVRVSDPDDCPTVFESRPVRTTPKKSAADQVMKFVLCDDTQGRTHALHFDPDSAVMATRLAADEQLSTRAGALTETDFDILVAEIRKLPLQDFWGEEMYPRINDTPAYLSKDTLRDVTVIKSQTTAPLPLR